MPTLFTLLVLLNYDGFDDFYKSYILTNIWYSTNGLHNNIGLSFIDRIIIFLKLFYRCRIYLASLIFMAFLSGMVFPWLLLKHSQHVKIESRFTLLFLVLLAAIYGIVRPGNDFEHYLILLVVPLVLFSAYLIRPCFVIEKERVIYYILVMSSVIIHFFFSLETRPLGIRDVYDTQYVPQHHVASIIAQYATPNSRIAVWGWEPKIYVYSGCIQATREGNTLYQIANPTQHDYYIHRYIADLERNQPKVFVDAIGEKTFFFNRPYHRAEAFPEIKSFLDKNFTLKTVIEGMRIYIQR